MGKSTIVKYKGKEVDSNKLRRYAKTAARGEVVLKSIAGFSGGGGGSLFNPLPLRNTM
jgi:hypothetical protein